MLAIDGISGSIVSVEDAESAILTLAVEVRNEIRKAMDRWNDLHSRSKVATA